MKVFSSLTASVLLALLTSMVIIVCEIEVPFLPILANVLIRILSFCLNIYFFTNITVAISNKDFVKNFNNLLFVLLYFSITTAIAAIIGLSVPVLLKKFTYTSMVFGNIAYNIPINAECVDVTSISLIPDSIMQLLTEVNLIRVLIISIITAMCLMFAKKTALYNYFNLFTINLNAIFDQYIYYFIPVFTYVITVNSICSNYGNFLVSIGYFLATYIIGIICILSFMYLPIIHLYYKGGIIEFFKISYSMLVVAFLTASSIVTLPTTMKTGEKLGIRSDIAKTIISIGSMVNMDGTALFLGLFCSTVSILYSVSINYWTYALIVFFISIMAIITPGIPGATLLIVLGLINLTQFPTDCIGIIPSVGVFIEMFGTVVNVLGDLIGAIFFDYLKTEYTKR